MVCPGPAGKSRKGQDLICLWKIGKCPHDNVNELRTGEINAAPKGRSLPRPDWDQSPQGDGETPNQSRHKRAEDSILTTCIQL